MISKTFRKIWSKLSDPHRRRLLRLTALSLLTNGLDVLAIALVGIVGVLAIGGPTPTLPTFLENYTRESLIMLLAGSTFLLFALKSCLSLWLIRARQKVLAEIETFHSARIAEHLMIIDRKELDKHSRAEIEWMVLRSTNTAFTGVIGNLLQLVSEIGLTAFVFVVFLVSDWQLALAVAGFLAAVFFSLQSRVGILSQRAGEKVTEGSIGVGQSIQDYLSAYREIVVLDNSRFFLDRLVKHREMTAFAQAQQLVLSALPRLITEIGLILGAAILTGYLLIWSETDSGLPTVGIFLAGSLRMMSAFLPIQRAAIQLKYDRPLAESALDVLETISNFGGEQRTIVEESDEVGAIECEPPELGASDSIDNVSFSYSPLSASGSTLRGVTLEIPSGSYVAIIGPSGAGKSTLADLIMGIATPNSGAILLDGMPPASFIRLRRGELGYVPQRPGLVSGSVRANLMLGDEEGGLDDTRLWESLRQAHLIEYVRTLPKGLDEDLGPHSDKLSGGQLQRLGLARALLRRPRLLLLDEATSALDEETQHLVTDSLATLSRQTTRVVIAHRLSTVKHADFVMIIENGVKKAFGSFGSLRKQSSDLQRWIELSGLE